MIYLIGGVARSGKSSTRRHLLKHHGISGIETDSLRTTLEIASPKLNIHYKNDPHVNAALMHPYIVAFIESRLFFDEDFIIEGDCITPAVAAAFAGNKNVKTVFMGYPYVAPRDKFDQLSQDLEGWTAGVSTQELKTKIKQFIHDSSMLEASCRAQHLPFVDTSSRTLTEVVEACVRQLGFVGAEREDSSSRLSSLSS